MGQESFFSYRMNWFDYYLGHVFPTGWRTVWHAFRIWRDLMTDSYDDYVVLKEDNPFKECYEWFWCTLGEDDIYPKEFLEELYELCRRIESGEEKVIPISKDFFDKYLDEE